MNLQKFTDTIPSSQSSLLTMQNELEQLATLLAETQQIMYMTSGKFEGFRWLITCLDTQMIVLRTDADKDYKMYTINYQSIVRAHVKKGMTYAKLELLTAATRRPTFAFEYMDIEESEKLLTIIKNHQKKNTMLKMKSNAQPLPIKEDALFHFHVEGVTGKNNKGQRIQVILQKEGKKFSRKNHLMAYDGLTVHEIANFGDGTYEFSELYLDDQQVLFFPDTNNSKSPDALLVYIKFEKYGLPIHIGQVPLREVKMVKKILSKSKSYTIEGHYVGGNTKLVNNERGDASTTVQTVALEIGVEITLMYKMKK